MGMKVRVSRSVLIGIQRISAEVAPREACGLLFGAPDRITDWQAVENVAEEPERHFEIEPGALFAALRAERAGGPKIAGYWHSHPSGDVTPSVTDAAMAQPDGKLWLIVAQGGETLWRAEDRGPLHGRFAPVELILA
jgi:proteasome lid subunit RPN8/RPN11